MFDVCERLVPPRAAGADTIHESYPVWCEHSLSSCQIGWLSVGRCTEHMTSAAEPAARTLTNELTE